MGGLLLGDETGGAFVLLLGLWRPVTHSPDGLGVIFFPWECAGVVNIIHIMTLTNQFFRSASVPLRRPRSGGEKRVLKLAVLSEGEEALPWRWWRLTAWWRGRGAPRDSGGQVYMESGARWWDVLMESWPVGRTDCVISIDLGFPARKVAWAQSPCICALFYLFFFNICMSRRNPRLAA